MEFLPQILPVSRDINEHDSTSCGLDSTMGFGNNRRRPASSWFVLASRLDYIKVYLTGNNHQITQMIQAIGCLNTLYLFVRSTGLDNQSIDLALRIS